VLGGISTLLISTLLSAGTVQVRGDLVCPSASEVSERLQPLLPRRSPDASDAHRATLTDVGPQPDGRKELHLRLLRSDGSSIGERSLLVAGDCKAMADAAAVVIAAWETEDPSALPAPIDKPPAPASDQPRGRPLQWLGGVGAGVGFVGGTALVGGMEAQVGRSDSHWRLRLSAMREGTRRIDLGSGQADWRHTMFAAGLVLQGAAGAWSGSVDLGSSLGWVTARGVGFPKNQTSDSLEYGVMAGARAGRRIGRLTLWVEARSNAWLRGQRALLTNVDSKATLPRADASVSLGTTFLIFQ
jgi:hypothetical protein